MKATHKVKLVLKLLVGVLALVLISCSEEDKSRLLKQNVSGKAGEIIVVTDKSNWETEPGMELRNVLAVEYPYLPQVEPSYTLINIAEKDFTNIFQIHRNIIYIKVDSEKFPEPELVSVEDVWAAPQLVMYITAPTKEAAATLIKDKTSTIFNTFGQAERNRIIRNCKKFEELGLRQLVAEQLGGSPYFPKGYSLKKKTDDFIWISCETTYINQGFLMYKLPYKDSTSVTLENLIACRNDVMQKNVPGMFENSYMTTSQEIVPGISWVKYKDKRFAEIRGLWEVKNDFMGGPFVMHTHYNPENPTELIVIEAFVYAPRYDKRQYIRQVESILYSFEWKKEFTK